MVTRCKFRGRRGIFWHVLKIDGSLARNIDFEVANFQVLRKTRRKTSILQLQSVKIGWSLARNARFGAPTCLVSRLWFPVASPCLWGKLQNLSFCHVAKCENRRKSHTKCWFFCIHVSCLESLVFLWRRRVYGGSWKTCPIRMCPSKLSCRFAWQAWHFVTFQTCLITCRKCQNWRKSRTKCSFFCTHVSRLESLVFLWRRRVYEGSCKTSPFPRFPSRLSCRFAWQAWHFVTFQPVW